MTDNFFDNPIKLCTLMAAVYAFSAVFSVADGKLVDSLGKIVTVATFILLRSYLKEASYMNAAPHLRRQRFTKPEGM